MGGLRLPIKSRLSLNSHVNENGCWIWDMAKNKDGYGTVTYEHKTWLAHRLSFTVFVGSIPKGKVIDHTCNIRACINPNHLKPSTDGDNFRRSNHPKAILHREQRCKEGHSVTGDNIQWGWYGPRCRICYQALMPRKNGAL